MSAKKITPPGRGEKEQIRTGLKKHPHLTSRACVAGQELAGLYAQAMASGFLRGEHHKTLGPQMRDRCALGNLRAAYFRRQRKRCNIAEEKFHPGGWPPYARQKISG
ncbi:MAG: hypothetical protein ACO3L2_08160 [Chthoniobacterales bacterium]